MSNRHKKERRRVRQWLGLSDFARAAGKLVTEREMIRTPNAEREMIRAELLAARGWKTSATSVRIRETR